MRLRAGWRGYALEAIHLLGRVVDWVWSVAPTSFKPTVQRIDRRIDAWWWSIYTSRIRVKQ